MMKALVSAALMLIFWSIINEMRGELHLCYVFHRLRALNPTLILECPMPSCENGQCWFK